MLLMSNEEYARIVEPRTGTERGDIRGGWVTADRVTIELTDVRAADSLTITYDFERDGWVVLMDKTEDKGDFMDVVEEQAEVGFFPAWNTRMGDEKTAVPMVTVDVQTGSSPRSMAVKVPDTLDEAISLSRIIRTD